MAWRSLRLWDEWGENQGWKVHRFGLAYHEEVAILLGLARQEEFRATGWEDWIHSASGEWNSLFGPPDWATDFAPPEAAERGQRLRVLGQGWVWTGEWDAPPEERWEGLGRVLYGGGCFATFDWGLLGYRPGSEVELPRFDVHTTVAAKADRDVFLFSALPAVLMSFLKATQFYKAQYEEVLGLRLDQREQEVRSSTETRTDPSQMPTKQAVKELSIKLYKLSHEITRLDEYGHGLELARSAMIDLLSFHGAHGTRLLLDPAIERLSAQLLSDLRYYRTTETLGLRALETDRILTSIEDTRASRQLAVVGILVGSFVGLAKILPDYWSSWLRLAISLSGAFASSVAYWAWSRRSSR